MELKNNGKINFIIDLFINFKDQMSGGLVALHRLSYELAEKGHNVYIFCQPEYSHENIHVIPCTTEIQGSRFYSTWEPFSYNLNNTVSIYTEHNLNNPFGTKHITRWLLYHTKREFEEHYQDNEYYFNYGGCYTYRGYNDGYLTTVDYNLNNLYCDININNRTGYCHILHKNTPTDGDEIIKKFNSKDLGKDWFYKGGFDYLREEFNKHEYFITFDQNTYLTTAAALCGCKSIILNPNNKDNSIKNAYTESLDYKYSLTPTEYRLGFPRNMFGVAYGIEDIKWAKDTIHLVRDHIIELEKIDKKSVDKFVDFWNQKCYE
jgi:hypothetical protein